MEQAIRHLDGTLITSGEWSAIRATARKIKTDLLALPAPRDRRAKDRPKTKTYYRSFFPKEWDAALEKMEQLQPLLALCAAHWKADHVLGNTLLVRSSAGADDKDDDEPMNTDNLGTQGTSETKKRSASRHNSTSREAKKRRKAAERAQRPNETASTIGIPDTASKEPIDSQLNASSAEPTQPDTAAGTTAVMGATGTSAASGSATAIGMDDMLNASGAAAGGTAAVGATAVGLVAAGTAAVGPITAGAKAMGASVEMDGVAAAGAMEGTPDTIIKAGTLTT